MSWKIPWAKKKNIIGDEVMLEELERRMKSGFSHNKNTRMGSLKTLVECERRWKRQKGVRCIQYEAKGSWYLHLRDRYRLHWWCNCVSCLNNTIRLEPSPLLLYAGLLNQSRRIFTIAKKTTKIRKEKRTETKRKTQESVTTRNTIFSPLLSWFLLLLLLLMLGFEEGNGEEVEEEELQSSKTCTQLDVHCK